ncbi:MAG: AAA family ATPase [Patescibacteria group bacterium]
MYLKSIELNGFKSFAKKSELTFTSKVSAIVGPNGSGKSNVAEAFRFVLGEQSIKSLRGKKGEDLIFNGAGDLPRANRASVKIVFDNSTKFLPIDFDTVTLERIVHRDSVNEYLINGSQVRLKDIIELLASAHIGSSGHHIISQGEADRILNASIKERKAMIEEALGLKVYQYKKVESEKKLSKTKENIAHVESLRREIAPHIRFLKKQVEKVEKALELRKELETEALEYCRREDEYIKLETSKIEDIKKPLLEQQRALEEELTNAKKVLSEGESQDKKSDELLSLESAIHTCRNEKDALFRDFGRIDGEISSLIRMIEKQERVASSHEYKTVPLVSVEGVRSQIEKKIQEVRYSQDFFVLIKTLDDVYRLVSDFIEQNKDKVDMSLLVDAQKDIEALRVSKQGIEQKIQIIQTKEKELEVSYNRLKESIEKEKDSNRDAEKAVFRIMTEAGETRNSLKLIESEEDLLRMVKEDFRRELTELGVLLGSHILQYASLTFDFSESRSAQEERRRKLEKIKIRLEDSGAGSAGDVMKEYKDATERDEFLQKELTDLDNSAKSLNELIQELDLKLGTEFRNGIDKINTQFREYFAMMFGGGTAELSVIKTQKRKKLSDELMDVEGSEEFISDEPEEDGIEIEVNLPKKKVKGLMMLSGGERALTSIALLFAISQVNPPPFIILDETDAALDEANSKKYGDMVENLSKFSQLIVITHNRETMSRAGILYGVTMGSGGGSKLLSVAFEEAVSTAK